MSAKDKPDGKESRLIDKFKAKAKELDLNSHESLFDQIMRKIAKVPKPEKK